MRIELHIPGNYIIINKIAYMRYGIYNTLVFYETYDNEKKTILFDGILNLNEIIIKLEETIKKEDEQND